MKWDKILCPVDFSKVSMEALNVSGELAEKFGAGLIIVHVLEPILAPTDFSFGPLSMTDVEDKLAERAQEGLEQAAANLNVPKEKIQNIVARGIGSQEIIRIASREGRPDRHGHARLHGPDTRSSRIHRRKGRKEGRLPCAHRQGQGEGRGLIPAPAARPTLLPPVCLCGAGGFIITSWKAH